MIRGGAPEPRIGKHRINTVMIKGYSITGGDKSAYLPGRKNGASLIDKRKSILNKTAPEAAI